MMRGRIREIGRMKEIERIRDRKIGIYSEIG